MTDTSDLRVWWKLADEADTSEKTTDKDLRAFEQMFGGPPWTFRWAHRHCGSIATKDEKLQYEKLASLACKDNKLAQALCNVLDRIRPHAIVVEGDEAER